jgi:D-alanyl-D-alanine carboxypeptidase
MYHDAPARAEARRAPRLVLVGLAVIIAAIIGALVHQPASSAAPASSEVPVGDHGGTGTEDDGATTDDAVRDGAVTEDDGALPDGVTVFDDEYPGVANLDPDLLQALRDAAADAADDGVEIQVNSGWRSAEYQEQLFREAVSEYGSEEEAARWVATVDTSAHVSGDAVDIGPFDATAWLSQHGADYGLCQIYRNESWHFELRPEATYRGCPPLDAGPARDMRMRR